ncbi:hypothetical protein GGR56DRAFT_73506 [Xylariaceae sp. FL0804]|nr:hypothetical protein GGR56DRAFT_73506 [Xylariaceae sp. FL0804]
MSSSKSSQKGASSKHNKSSKHHGSSHGSRGHGHSHGKGHSHGTSGASPADVSFLFVVNELVLDPYAAPPTPDTWGNPNPPRSCMSYAFERPGHVFRYHNRVVQRAPDNYSWWRLGGQGTVGGIVVSYERRDEASGRIVENSEHLVAYSTTTVVDCGPFVPCVGAPGDAFAQDYHEGDFRSLHFNHDDAHGLSRASIGGGEYKYVCRNASWLGTLVPETYRNLEQPLQQTGALAGELGPLLGLMALAEPVGATDRAFERDWNGTRWRGSRQNVVSAHGPTRTVVVHVALDPEDPNQDSSYAWESISYFEQHGWPVA